MGKERLTKDMSLRDVISSMAGGNPGAMTVVMSLMQYGQQIDPDAFHGGFGAILQLDSLGIYEDKIWVLFKYGCDHDLAKMVAVLRAYQLGQLAGVNSETLKAVLENNGEKFDLDAVVEAVKDRLPNFQPEALAA